MLHDFRYERVCFPSVLSLIVELVMCFAFAQRMFLIKTVEWRTRGKAANFIALAVVWCITS